MGRRHKPRQGKYSIKNRSKYVGKHEPIYRSSWELKLMIFLDNDPRILAWDYEPFPITYNCQVRGDVHRYFPDFLIKLKTKDGVEVWMVEVKPESQSQPPKKTARKSNKTFLAEQRVWKVNESKWKAAQEFCDSKGWKFKVMGETALAI